MAALTATQYARLRHELRRKWTTPIDFNKVTIDAAFQAMDDWFEAEKPTVSGLIDDATDPPKVFTNAEKKMIAGVYMILKSETELV